MVTDPSIPPETVIREADAAMYRAKELGRSRYELFDEASRQRATERLELEAALREARRALRAAGPLPAEGLARRRGRRGRLRGAGALAAPRARADRRPDEFIPLAEETGLIAPIGEFVLEEALRQICRWRQTRPEVTMSVNLSARQLEDPGLRARCSPARSRRRGASPDALCLEVTEERRRAQPRGLDQASCRA